MKTVAISNARANIFRLVAEAAEEHEPILLVGKKGNAVLVPEEDWDALQETIYLLSKSGMRQALKEGSQTPLSKCCEEKDLPW